MSKIDKINVRVRQKSGNARARAHILPVKKFRVFLRGGLVIPPTIFVTNFVFVMPVLTLTRCYGVIFIIFCFFPLKFFFPRLDQFIILINNYISEVVLLYFARSVYVLNEFKKKEKFVSNSYDSSKPLQRCPRDKTGLELMLF